MQTRLGCDGLAFDDADVLYVTDEIYHAVYSINSNTLQLKLFAGKPGIVSTTAASMGDGVCVGA